MKPWEDIETPDATALYSVRLADPKHPFDFFWGKNVNGQFVFRFFGDFDAELCLDAPNMSGISTVGGIENKRSHITLVLEDKEDAKIFYMLCRSLMHATEILLQGNDTSAVRVIMTHLFRWQRLLQNRRSSKELSLNEQIGLFGELLVLKDVFLSNLDTEPAVLCWTGPVGDEQDFSYGRSLVEVKTTRASRDRKIRISSVDQLDSVSGDITLAFQTLAHLEKEAEGALSLNALISNLREMIASSGAATIEIFETRLMMMGYEETPSYDKNFFTPVIKQFFAVEGTFPRICAADIPEGAVDISYSLLVDSCMPWLISDEQTLDRIFRKND
jgi:hypothetical protein